MEQLEGARRARRVTYTQLTRMAEVIETQGDSWSQIQISIKLNLLDSYLEKFDRDQSIIEQASDSESEHRGKFEDIYSSLKEKLLILKSKFERECSTMPAMSSSSTSKSKSMLPPIQLPKFDGCYSKWPDFISMFETLIDNDQDLSSIEKFQMLRSSLTGTASIVIQSLECSEENYKKALELLTARYCNKRLIFGAHINKLINLPPVSRGSVQHMRNLVDVVNGEVRALQSIGSKEQIADAILINTVANKLDSVTRARWEESVSLKEIPSWITFVDFLQRRCETLEHIQSTSVSASTENTTNYRKRDHTGKLITNIAARSLTKNCTYCTSTEHTLNRCRKFNQLSTKDRFNYVKNSKLCINCLREGHIVKSCKSSSCAKCGQRHHTILHFHKPVAVNNLSSEEKRFEGENKNCLSASSMETLNETILIATALVQVTSDSGMEATCRILLDSASQTHFVTERLAQQIGLKRSRCHSAVVGIGSLETNIKYKVNCTVKSRLTDFEAKIEALVLPTITTDHPARFINIKDWELPRNIELADPSFNHPARIDGLLGAEFFMKLLCVGQIDVGKCKPTIQKTLLGWVVSGKYKECHQSNQLYEQRSLVCGQKEGEDDINTLIEEFWKIEENFHYSKPWTDEERQCEEHFKKHTSRDANGRFIVRLPFKEDPSTLGSSLHAAKQRLESLQNKFRKSFKFRQAYEKFMEEYRTLGHMEPLPNSLPSSKTYYMPHHCVEQLSATSTKLRVVFDASCKSTSGKSLNDILMVGPVCQEDLFSILCRFRLYKYVLTSDITKMYRQILVDRNDATYQSILWYDDYTK